MRRPTQRNLATRRLPRRLRQRPRLCRKSQNGKEKMKMMMNLPCVIGPAALIVIIYSRISNLSYIL